MTGRVVTTAALCLQVGAVVNVLVAWGCAAWSPVVGPPYPYGRNNGGRWLLPAPEGWPLEPPRTFWASAPGVTEVLVSAGRGSAAKDGAETSKRYGCPFRAVAVVTQTEIDSELLQVQRLPATMWHSGLDLPSSLGWLGVHQGRALPLMPLWPGFAGNTIVYALGAYGLVVGRGAARRSLRRRRGLCLACGYPVGVSQVCTECGRAVRASMPRA